MASLSDQTTTLQQLRERQRRCGWVLERFRSWPLEVIDKCNMCGSRETTIIANNDRYGLPIRSGLCRSCGLIFLVDRLTSKGYTQFYQSTYRPLISSFLGRPENDQTIAASQRKYAQDLLRFLRGLCSFTMGSRLLDIGGSIGIVAEQLASRYGLEATVVDPSPAEIEVARSRGINGVCAQFEAWDYADESFDVILCARTIDHFMDLKGSLLKMRRLVRPGGTLLIDIVDFMQIFHSRGLIEAALKIDHCYYLYSEPFVSLLAATGWEALQEDIASSPERLFYICKPCLPKPLPRLSTDVINRYVRVFQMNKIQGAWQPRNRSFRKRARRAVGRMLRFLQR